MSTFAAIHLARGEVPPHIDAGGRAGLVLGVPTLAADVTYEHSRREFAAIGDPEQGQMTGDSRYECSLREFAAMVQGLIEGQLG